MNEKKSYKSGAYETAADLPQYLEENALNLRPAVKN